MNKIITIKSDDKKLQDWIKQVDNATSNPKTLFQTIEPIVLKSVQREFSDANLNQWKPLSKQYLDQKIKDGFPATIGIRTGALKFAATKGAIKTFTKDSLIWKLNEDVVNKEGDRVGNYVYRFHESRNIFKYSLEYLKKIISNAINIWMK